MELNGTQREQLTGALISAFPRMPALERMVDFKLDENLEAIASTADLLTAASGLVRWAESQGRTGELIVGARAANPGNPKLAAFAQQYTLPTVAQKNASPERIVLKNSHFANIDQWSAGLAARKEAVCRVETSDGRGIGTGFLIGPSLVMTNCHVVANPVEGLPNGAVAVPLKLNFGYRMAANGVTELPSQLYDVSGPGQWLMDASKLADLDYAVIRLVGSPGNDPPTGGGGKRGWLTPVEQSFEPTETLMIIQHPEGAPLKVSFGSSLPPPQQPGRVAYSANTLGGSSGSPVFNSDLDLVALHHYGDPTGNRGIPFSLILPRLRENLHAKGLLSLLGDGSST